MITNIVIATFNKLKFTQLCIQSIRDYTPTNQGFPKACNQGMEIAQGDSISLLNNDTIVTKNWLSNMLAALFSDESVGAVGTVTNSISKAKVLYSLAAVAYEQQQYEVVIPQMQRALEYEPSHPNTLYNLAYVIYQAGEKEMARSYLKQLNTEDQVLVASAHKLEEVLSQ